MTDSVITAPIITPYHVETVEFAWAAGLFEGEGCVTRSGSSARLSLKMVDEETVRRFCTAVKCGIVYGPYANRTGETDGYPRRDFFMWVATSRDAAVLARRLYPLLSSVRRARVEEVFGV